MIYFMSVVKISNTPLSKKFSLIEPKYQLRLRAQELSKDFGISSIGNKKSSNNRRMTIPSINIEKTSSLRANEEMRAKLNLNKHSLMGVIGEEKEVVDYSQLNQEMLSPEVKDFLRKNRIRMRKTA